MKPHDLLLAIAAEIGVRISHGTFHDSSQYILYKYIPDRYAPESEKLMYCSCRITDDKLLLTGRCGPTLARTINLRDPNSFQQLSELMNETFLLLSTPDDAMNIIRTELR